MMFNPFSLIVKPIAKLWRFAINNPLKTLAFAASAIAVVKVSAQDQVVSATIESAPQFPEMQAATQTAEAMRCILYGPLPIGITVASCTQPHKDQPPLHCSPFSGKLSAETEKYRHNGKNFTSDLPIIRTDKLELHTVRGKLGFLSPIVDKEGQRGGCVSNFIPQEFFSLCTENSHFGILQVAFDIYTQNPAGCVGATVDNFRHQQLRT